MNSKKLNNKGATLVAVLIVIAIVGILAASLCVMTMVNSQMKRVDRKSKDNFYSAETALDEITLGLQEDLANSTKDAYGWLLVNYLSDDSDADEKSAQFKKKVREKFMLAMKKGLNTSQEYSNEEITANIKVLLGNYLTDEMKQYATVENVSGFVEDKTKNEYVILKAVKVKYVNGDFSNTITTDIKITIPEAQFSVDLPYSAELPFQSYALMAKEDLVLGSRDTLEINGNLYLGGNSDKEALTLKDTAVLNVKAKNIITGGDVKLLNTSIVDDVDASSLNVTPREKVVNFWTTNLYINATRKVTGKISTDLKVTNGNLYVADDLMLNSPYSRVSLSGSYYGYGLGLEEDENGKKILNESKSSAIIVNGLNSKLDLRKCTNLNVFGRAVIAFPEFNETSKKTNEIEIPTGESITVRGNQIAYLVPSKCISVKHNPISKAEATALNKNGDTLKDIVDLSACDGDGTDSQGNPFSLLNYCKANSAIVKMFNVTGTGTNSCVYYLYLDFKDNPDEGYGIDDFFVSYCNIYGTEQMAGIFTLDGNNGLETCVDVVENEDGSKTVKASGTINTTGSAVAQYAYDGKYSETVVGGNASSISGTSRALQTQYTYFWSSLRNGSDDKLKERYREAGISDYTSRDAVTNLLDNDIVEKIFDKVGNRKLTVTYEGNTVNETYESSTSSTIVIECKESGKEYRVVLIDNLGGAAYRVSGNRQGMIIATGNVEIADGAQFTGLIVAGATESSIKGQTGHVELVNGNATLAASESVISFILGKTDAFKFKYNDVDGEEKEIAIGEIFMDPAAGQISYVPEEDNADTEDQDLAKLITYENWVKD